MPTNERKILTTFAINGEKDYKAAMNSAYSELKVLSSELKANSAEFASNEKSVEALTKKDQLLRQEISQQKEIVNSLTQAAKEAAEAYGEDSKKANEYKIKLNNAKTALSNMENALEANNKDLSDAKNKLKAVSDGLATMSTKLKSTGAAMVSAGKKVTTHITAPIIGAAGAAVKLAADYEESINKINTLDLSASSAKIQGIKDDITSLSNATGVAATDIGEATYQMASALGSLGSDVVDYVEIATKAAIGGFTDAETAANGLTTIFNTYGYATAEEMERISDLMLTAQNLGKTTFGEIAFSVGNVVPIFAQAGGSAEELMSSYAILTKNGIATSKATTGLKAAISNILKPTKDAAAAAKTLGLDFSAANIQANGWSGMLKDINASLKKTAPEYAALTETYAQQTAQLDALMKKKDASKTTDKALNDQISALKKEMKQTSTEMEIMANAANSPIAAYSTLFGSVEGLNSMLVLSSDQGIKQYNDAMDSMADASGATDAAYEKMQEGISAKSRKIVQSFKNFGIEIGDKLIAKLEPALEWAKEMTDKLDDLDDETKTTIITVAGIAAAVGPAIIIAGKMTTAIGQVSRALSYLAANPVALAIVGVVALTAAWMALSKSMQKNNTIASKMSDASKERIREVNDQRDAYYDLKNAQAEQAEADLAQVRNTQSLWEELQTLTSETGYVTAANQARVSYILNELNSAYGTEYALIDGMITKYQDMQTEIDNLIEKRKYEIVQKAALPLYEKAVTDEIDLRMSAERDLAALEEAKAEREAEYARLVEKYGQDRVDAMSNEVDGVIWFVESAGIEYNKLNNTVKNYETSYADTTASVKTNLSDQTSYQEAQLLAQNGNYEEAFAVLSWYASETGQKFQEMQGDQQAQRQFLENEYEIAVAAFSTYLTNVADGTEEFNETTLRSLAANASSLYEKGKELGANVSDGFVVNLKGQDTQFKLGGAIGDVTNFIVTKFKNLLGIKSPSKVMEEDIARNTMLGWAGGIKKYAGMVSDAFGSIIPDTKTAALSLDINRHFNDVVTSAGGGQARYVQSSQVNNSRQQTINYNYTVKANNTSYAEQQRQARKSQQNLVRELSAVGI